MIHYDYGPSIDEDLPKYLDQIRGVPILPNKNDEQALRSIFSKGGDAHLDQLVDLHRPLVVSVAEYYASYYRTLGSELPLRKLIWSGNMALHTAAELMNWNAAYRFTTYAFCFIQLWIRRNAKSLFTRERTGLVLTATFDESNEECIGEMSVAQMLGEVRTRFNDILALYSATTHMSRREAETELRLLISETPDHI